jgi:hypothetical protein
MILKIKSWKRRFLWFLLALIMIVAGYIFIQRAREQGSPRFVKPRQDTIVHRSIILCQKKWLRLDSVFNATETGLLKPGYISRVKALENSIDEISRLGYDANSWEFEFYPSGYPFTKFTADNSFGPWRTVEWKRKVSWIDGHTFWRLAAWQHQRGGRYYIFVDAYSGKVLCVVPAVGPVPEEWAKRYDRKKGKD